MVGFFCWPSALFATADMRCWKKNDCEKIDEYGLSGTFYKSEETISACGVGNDANGIEIGFCSPAGSAKTEIKFADRTVFSNIGEFIKWIYKYCVQIAVVLAVVMIIVSGFQWLISGGNQESIGSAKKRIGGALMGLFLAVMSYFILNQINPYMVNLRMPQMWKINKMGITPPICSELKDERKLSAIKGGPYELKADQATCGTEYYVENTGDLPCKGNICSNTKYCSPYFFNENEGLSEKFVCYEKKTFSILYKTTNSFLTFIASTAGAWIFDTIQLPNWWDMENGVGAGNYIMMWCKQTDNTSKQIKFKLEHGKTMSVYIIKREQNEDLKAHYFWVDYSVDIPYLAKKACDELGGVPTEFNIIHEVKKGKNIAIDKTAYFAPENILKSKKVIGGNWEKMKSVKGFPVDYFADGSNPYFFGEFELTDSAISNIMS